MADPYASFSKIDENPSFMDQVTDYAKKHGRDIATIAGGTIGGLVAAPLAAVEAAPTLGLGSVATEMGGVGLGAGIGNQAYDLLSEKMGWTKPQTPIQRAGTAIKDVAENAVMVPAVKGGVAAISPVVKKVIAPATGKLLAAVLGRTSTLGPDAVKAAYEAGAAGGVPAQVLRQNVSKDVPVTDVLTAAEKNLSDKYAARNLKYQTDIAPISNDTQQIPFKSIDQAVVENKSTAVGRRGQIVNPEANNIIQNIQKEIDIYKANGWNSPGDLDDLKKSIGQIRSKTEPGSPAFRAADQIYSSVEDAITQHAPDYAKVMSDYSGATTAASDIRKGLSLNANASNPTKINRLIAALKGGSPTNSARSELLNNLVGPNDQTIIPALTGQAMRPLFPNGYGAAAIGAGETAAQVLSGHNPLVGAAQILTAPAFSPRLVGEGAFALGKGANLVNKTLNAIPEKTKQTILRNAAIAAALAKKDQEQ